MRRESSWFSCADFQIHARTEYRTRRGQNHDAHSLFFDFVESALQLSNHRRVDGVALVRAI
jgi:hypothetical protein